MGVTGGEPKAQSYQAEADVEAIVIIVGVAISPAAIVADDAPAAPTTVTPAAESTDPSKIVAMHRGVAAAEAAKTAVRSSAVKPTKATSMKAAHAAAMEATKAATAVKAATATVAERHGAGCCHRCCKHDRHRTGKELLPHDNLRVLPLVNDNEGQVVASKTQPLG
jgi:hypothetical protein